MDGFQSEKITRSLRCKLIFRISALVLCFGFATGAYVYFSTVQRSIRVLDSELAKTATFFTSYNVRLPVNSAQGTDRFLVLPLPVPTGDPSGLAVLDTERVQDGLHIVDTDKEKWRIWVSTRNSGERFIVATSDSVRLRLAWIGVLGIALPFLLLMLCLIVGISLTVRTVLAPVQRMTQALDERDAQDLHRLETSSLPVEIQPFVASINRLLDRVAASVTMQRRFVADAAHELRSPLAALLLQAERLERTDLPPEAKTRLKVMRDGFYRTQVLVEQMLAMARAQERQFGSAEQFCVTELVAAFFEDLLPQAEAKNIDLGMVESDAITMTAPVAAVGLILKNLLENAIRYTPERGRVDLHVHRENHTVIFRLSDSGPGIPEHERERVFDSFYRCPDAGGVGSGLGLSIVKTVIEHLGGTIALHHANASIPEGLLVIVTLPG